MKIVCESCGAKYSIADEKVAGKVFKIRCKKCSAVIVVKGDQPQEGMEETRVYDYGSDALWHVVVNGEQQGPFAPRQIGELLAEGKIDWEAYVWRESMEGWQPAKDVEALVTAVMAESEGAGETMQTSAAESGRPGGEVFGGSNDMGADPFAGSSDDGGLSGVIGQSVASATAAGGGADLFADSSSSRAFATAAAEDDDDGPRSGSFGGPKVSEAQAMTGQRNENSVLFSLSNLQALATGSGASPASARGKGGMAQGEGSGLIDIRALASATQTVAERPNTNARDKIEDLLAVGSTGTTFSATTLAAPVVAEKSERNRFLLYGMAAAILALGGAVTYLTMQQSSSQPTAQLTPTADAVSPPTPAPGAAAPAAPTEAPQAAEPLPSAAAEPAEREEEGTKHASRDRDRDRDHDEDRHRDRSSRRHSGESASAEKAEPAPAEEAPAPKRPSGDKSIDDLLDTALGGGGGGGKAKPPAAAPSKPAASENLAPTPTREEVLSAMKSIAPRVQACGGGESGVAMAKVSVTGATGKISSVDVGGQFAGTPAAACIAKEVAKAKFPRFAQSSFSFSYPFKI